MRPSQAETKGFMIDPLQQRAAMVLFCVGVGMMVISALAGLLAWWKG